MNEKEINANELYELLESISEYIEIEVQMYALGGTALTILGVKQSTRDIDININSSKQYNYIREIFEKIGFKNNRSLRWFTQEGLAFDLFHGSNILGTQLMDDCLKLSKFIRKIGNIELYTLSLYDIIISKLARGDERDFIDIKHIFEKENINLKVLVERYIETMEVSIGGQHKQKLLDLIEIKFSDWKFKKDDKLINMVKEW